MDNYLSSNFMLKWNNRSETIAALQSNKSFYICGCLQLFIAFYNMRAQIMKISVCPHAKSLKELEN